VSLSPFQSWPDITINMYEYNVRKGQDVIFGKDNHTNGNVINSLPLPVLHFKCDLIYFGLLACQKILLPMSLDF
jgi:hypothetical protein